jgi:predicted DNA-binding protein (MmcQ/YjbR family)
MIKTFKKYVLGLAGTSLVQQWGSHVAKVGDKVFALIAEDGSSICFKVGEMSFDGLTELEGIGQAPYFAKRQWVAVDKDAALSEAELEGYVAASYKIVAAKLTRKLRAELDITVD